MRKRFAVFALFIFGLTMHPATAQPSDEMANLIANRLQQQELHIPADSGSGREGQKDVALLALQLDETRDQYATALSLQAQGLAPGKQVTTARAAYERVQVQLAGKKGKVKEALAAIGRERQLANNLAERYHSQLAEKGELPM